MQKNIARLLDDSDAIDSVDELSMDSIIDDMDSIIGETSLFGDDDFEADTRLDRISSSFRHYGLQAL